MKCEIINISDTWQDVLNACRTTVGKSLKSEYPTPTFKEKILLAEHSPIRLLTVHWKWTDIPWFVQTHFTRHKVGVEWFVKTSRSDRTGGDRNLKLQTDLIDMEGVANAQAIINMARKRLCNLASPETRLAMTMMIEQISRYEPELAKACVPECVYRGGCPEFKTCGKHEYVKILGEG